MEPAIDQLQRPLRQRATALQVHCSSVGGCRDRVRARPLQATVRAWQSLQSYPSSPQALLPHHRLSRRRAPSIAGQFRLCGRLFDVCSNHRYHAPGPGFHTCDNSDFTVYSMKMAVDDSLSARIPTDCPEDTRQVLLHAWSHDLDTLKKLLDARGKASAQDPTTGETPLHAAIRACGKADESDEDADAEAAEEDGVVEEARAVVQELFFSGAIWNDVDSNNETPGCVADRLGRKTLYNMCVDAGVRAELLFALMDGYEQLSSGSEDGADEEMTEADGAEVTENTEETGEEAEQEANEGGAEAQRCFVPPEAGEKTVTSDEYLKSELVYDSQKLVDSDLNGVMMSWETDIMNRSVATLIPDSAPGKRILNIGFGMGIIDSKFASLQPSRHHIIEAHPAVLKHIATSEDCKFGPKWEESGPEEGAFKVYAGKWQDIVPKLLAEEKVYDAIYFDTFGEDYSQLRMFFTEYVTGLLDQDGKFGFFNGLGADRKICYDVYTKVVEMHCAEAGMDVEWEELAVDMPGMDEAGSGEWEGVRRRYWTLKTYRLPICSFMG